MGEVFHRIQVAEKLEFEVKPVVAGDEGIAGSAKRWKGPHGMDG
jgi:hypothetical protein